QGNMALVGPRPELPRFTQHYKEKWEKVLSIRPGVIGYSQIKVPHETDLYPVDCLDHEAYYLEHILPEKLDNEIEYLQKKSTWLDFTILFRVTFSLLTRTITPRWLLIRYWHFHMLASDTLLACLSLYGSYLLVNQGGLSQEMQLQLSGALWIGLWLRPLVFFLFTLHRYPFSSSLSVGYIMRIIKAAFFSSMALIIVLMLAHEERDLVLSAHIVDLFLLPFILIVARLFYIALHDTLIEAGFFESLWRAGIHIVIAVGYGCIGLFSFWLAHFLRLQDFLVNRSAIHWEIILPVVFLVRAGFSFLLWPPRAYSWSDLVKHESVRIIQNAVLGTGFLLCAYLFFGIENFSRLALIYDFAIYAILALSITFVICISKIQDRRNQAQNRILIYGVGVETELFLTTLERMPNLNNRVIGIISDLEWKRFSSIAGINVLGTIYDLASIAELHRPNVLLTWERLMASTENEAEIKKICAKYGVALSIAPNIHDLVSQDFIAQALEPTGDLASGKESEIAQGNSV
ncbi:hypothetical protein GF373_02665, partial [bacterium]|nr:hypothetical protein [bacterium]